jgi:hypothetical protein
VAGLAGVPPAMTLSVLLLIVAWRQLILINPIPRKESSDLGEAELAMRGNHPGSLSSIQEVEQDVVESLGVLEVGQVRGVVDDRLSGAADF